MLNSDFSFLSRNRSLGEIEQQVFDLLIVGGGINGAGVAREAALRGLKVLLVEQGDFASGTSSRSSKLIHGGVRYLENLEFGLVFESLSERSKLLELAPHLVHPLKFVLPIYKGSRHPMWKLSLGMWLYDLLALMEAPEMHERWSGAETLDEVPQLKQKGLLGSFSYYDAYTDDDRLVLETIRGALRTGNAHALNYCGLDPKMDRREGIFWGSVSDHRGGRKYTVRARHLVSTVGPWTDIFSSKLIPNWKPVLRPTKGVHLVFDRARFPLKHAVVMNDDQKKRIVFGIPRQDYILLGTTDTDFRGDPGDVVATPEDLEYLLKMAAEYFPAAQLRKSDVMGCYAGVRPLYADGSQSEGKTSREHQIFSRGSGMTFVTGGKYTTYRKIASEVVDRCLESFPPDDRVRFGSSAPETSLNPRVTYETYDQAIRNAGEWARDFDLPEEFVRSLVLRYGEEAVDLLSFYDSRDPSESIEARGLRMETRFAIHHLGCMEAYDFLARRSPLLLSRRDHGASCIETVLEIFKEEMDLDDQEVARMRVRWAEETQKDFSVLS